MKLKSVLKYIFGGMKNRKSHWKLNGEAEEEKKLSTCFVERHKAILFQMWKLWGLSTPPANMLAFRWTFTYKNKTSSCVIELCVTRHFFLPHTAQPPTDSFSEEKVNIVQVHEVTRHHADYALCWSLGLGLMEIQETFLGLFNKIICLRGFLAKCQTFKYQTLKWGKGNLMIDYYQKSLKFPTKTLSLILLDVEYEEKE